MLLHSQDGYKTRNHFQALSCVKEEQERKDMQTTVRGMRTYYVRIFWGTYVPRPWKGSFKSQTIKLIMTESNLFYSQSLKIACKLL